jgi:hypothetical protein
MSTIEGNILPLMLDAAVPLWVFEFQKLTVDERQEKIKECEKDDLCLRLEYVLHRGPKEGDSARAFNDLAKAIALLSFCPGGVNAFGRHWDALSLCKIKPKKIRLQLTAKRERL